MTDNTTAPGGDGLDKILDATWAYGVDWSDYKDKSETDHEVTVYVAKIKADMKVVMKKKLNAYILAEMLALVGENYKNVPDWDSLMYDDWNDDDRLLHAQDSGTNREKNRIREAAIARFGKGGNRG